MLHVQQRTDFCGPPVFDLPWHRPARFLDGGMAARINGITLLEHRIQFAQELPAVTRVTVKNDHDCINAVRLAMRPQNARQPVQQGHLEGVALRFCPLLKDQSTLLQSQKIYRPLLNP